MNEDATAPAADESVDTGLSNISSEEGSVTADEVAQVLHIKTAAPAEQVEAEVEEETDADKSLEVDDTEGAAADDVTAKPVVEEPAPVVEAPSFALEVEDANGEKFVINPDDDIEEALKDFEPKSNGQIFKIIADFMEKKQAAKDHAEETAADEAQAAYDEKVANIQAGWNEEAKNLVGQKRLPVVAEGKENERLNEVFKFMMEENQKRTTDGKPPIQTLEDALDKLELKEKKEAEVEAAKKAKEDNRARGGMVGGSSAPASSGGPVYSPGMARNATEAAKKMGIL